MMRNYLIILLSFFPYFAYSQCKITHLSGTQNYNGTAVTVSETGSVHSIDSSTIVNYCNGKLGPYWIGIHYSPPPFTCKTGSYSFSFSPPATELYLNFSAINTEINGNAEIIRIYVNGLHYPLTSIGDTLGCQQLAMLTPDGDIASPNWDVAGWEGTKLSGTISTLTVQDSVLSGCGSGSFFSLSFCQWPLGNSDVDRVDKLVSVYPNPASSILQIKNATPKSAKQLYNAIGQLIHTPAPLERGSITEIDVSHLPKGIYYLKVAGGCKKVVVE